MFQTIFYFLLYHSVKLHSPFCFYCLFSYSILTNSQIIFDHDIVFYSPKGKKIVWHLNLFWHWNFLFCKCYICIEIMAVKSMTWRVMKCDIKNGMMCDLKYDKVWHEMWSNEWSEVHQENNLLFFGNSLTLNYISRNMSAIKSANIFHSSFHISQQILLWLDVKDLKALTYPNSKAFLKVCKECKEKRA